MATINILLATYNGQKYLKTQILSILGQTYTDWNLLIHDDGSSDGTIEIIKDFSAKDPRIKLIDDNIKGLGAGANFMHLLKYSEAPFLCFCDQDDCWLENKLEVMLELILQKNNEKPQVVFTNGYTWLPENQKIGRSSINNNISTIEEALYANGGMQGAAAIFNKEMRDFISTPYEKVDMHDQILTLGGIVSKGITFVDKPLFLYRQHDNNVTRHIPTNKKEQIQDAILYNQKAPVVTSRYYNEIKSFSIYFSDKISVEDKRKIEQYLLYPSMNPIKRMFSILKNGYTLKGSKLFLLFKLILRKYSLDINT